MIENRRKKILKKKKVLWAHDDIILNAILFFCLSLEETENSSFLLNKIHFLESEPIIFIPEAD